MVFREKLEVRASLLIVGHCAERRVYGKSMEGTVFPTCFDVGIFSFVWHVGVAQLVAGCCSMCNCPFDVSV